MFSAKWLPGLYCAPSVARLRVRVTDHEYLQDCGAEISGVAIAGRVADVHRRVALAGRACDARRMARSVGAAWGGLRGRLPLKP